MSPPSAYLQTYSDIALTEFICDELTNSCDADAAAKDLCEQATAAASAATKGSGAQADAFNAVFGIQTNFAAEPVIDNQGRVVSGGNAGSQTNTVRAVFCVFCPLDENKKANMDLRLQPAAGNGSNDNQDNDNQDNENQNNDNNNGENDENQNSDNNGGAAQAGNLQAFDEALGGVVAPTVTDLGGGRFQVEGNAAFNNIRSALVRSCDVQNNQCANAANSSGGTSDFSVADCNAQQAQCIALADSA